MLRDGSVGVETTWCGVEGGLGRVERETGRVERETSHVECETSRVERETSRVERETDRVERETGRAEHETSHAEHETSHAEHEATDEERCEQLHRKLKRIVKARAALDAEEAEALREAERVRVWRHYGYSSLLEYMEMEMGYTPRAALERLRVAKAIVELPAIAEAMAQGDLSFSAGRELTRVATPDTEQKWLDAANDKNLRQVEDMVSGHKPGDAPEDPVDPKLRKRRLRYDDIDEETYALLRQARQILERELGERIDDNTLLRTFARLVVDGARSPERTHAPYQVAVTVCERCKRGWQDGGGITVEMSPDKLEAALCDAQHIGAVDDAVGTAEHIGCGHEHEIGTAERMGRVGEHEAGIAEHIARVGEHEAGIAEHIARVAEHEAGITEHIARGAEHEAGITKRIARAGDPALAGESLDDKLEHGRQLARRMSATRDASPAKQPASQKASRAKSDIPPALRRKVRARDHGTCRVPWCRSSHNVDQHHMRPISQGGTHTLENIISLCESHHIAHHAGALVIEGTASNPTFTRRAHSAFTVAERIVETTAALRTLGFDKHEVSTAIEKTRTHVGTAELTIEQWIRIALSYCPKPRAG